MSLIPCVSDDPRSRAAFSAGNQRRLAGSFWQRKPNPRGVCVFMLWKVSADSSKGLNNHSANSGRGALSHPLVTKNTDLRHWTFKPDSGDN